MFVSPTTEWGVLLEEGIQAFHMQTVQFLKYNDCSGCLDFTMLMIHMITSNLQFLFLILLTDEASFTREVIFKSHYEYACGESNPHVTVSQKIKREIFR